MFKVGYEAATGRVIVIHPEEEREVDGLSYITVEAYPKIDYTSEFYVENGQLVDKSTRVRPENVAAEKSSWPVRDLTRG
jgi:hypothetical protein